MSHQISSSKLFCDARQGIQQLLSEDITSKMDGKHNPNTVIIYCSNLERLISNEIEFKIKNHKTKDANNIITLERYKTYSKDMLHFAINKCINQIIEGKLIINTSNPSLWFNITTNEYHFYQEIQLNHCKKITLHCIKIPHTKKRSIQYMNEIYINEYIVYDKVTKCSFKHIDHKNNYKDILCELAKFVSYDEMKHIINYLQKRVKLKHSSSDSSAIKSLSISKICISENKILSLFNTAKLIHGYSTKSSTKYIPCCINDLILKFYFANIYEMNCFSNDQKIHSTNFGNNDKDIINGLVSRSNIFISKFKLIFGREYAFRASIQFDSITEDDTDLNGSIYIGIIKDPDVEVINNLKMSNDLGTLLRPFTFHGDCHLIKYRRKHWISVFVKLHDWLSEWKASRVETHVSMSKTLGNLKTFASNEKSGYHLLIAFDDKSSRLINTTYHIELLWD